MPFSTNESMTSTRPVADDGQVTGGMVNVQDGFVWGEAFVARLVASRLDVSRKSFGFLDRDVRIRDE
jgi:hypothetical protein